MSEGKDDLLVYILEALGYDLETRPVEVEVDVQVDATDEKGEKDGPSEKDELIREESRTVLDHQIHNLNEVDDVAARTVRITAIIIGGLLGVTSLTGNQGVSLSNTYVLWGGAYLLLSVLLGLHTYNVSDPYFGPGKDVLNQWAGYESKSELLPEMNRKYAGWIDDMEVLEAINGISLDLTQVSLGIGLVYVSFGVLLNATPSDDYGLLRKVLVDFRDSAWHAAPLVVIVFITVVLFVYASRRF